jgi:hypothetical protein
MTRRSDAAMTARITFEGLRISFLQKTEIVYSDFVSEARTYFKRMMIVIRFTTTPKIQINRLRYPWNGP